MVMSFILQALNNSLYSIFDWVSNYFDPLVALEVKLVDHRRLYPLGNVNVCTTFHNNLLITCRNVSFWTNMVGRLSRRTYFDLFAAVNNLSMTRSLSLKCLELTSIIRLITSDNRRTNCLVVLLYLRPER